MVKNIREIRKELETIQVKVEKLMEDITPSYRELDILSQKLEEAIMWTYRIVALEKINNRFNTLETPGKQLPDTSNCCVDNSKIHCKNKCSMPKGEDYDVDEFIKLLKSFAEDNLKR